MWVVNKQLCDLCTRSSNCISTALPQEWDPSCFVHEDYGEPSPQPGQGLMGASLPHNQSSDDLTGALGALRCLNSTSVDVCGIPGDV